MRVRQTDRQANKQTDRQKDRERESNVRDSLKCRSARFYWKLLKLAVLDVVLVARQVDSGHKSVRSAMPFLESRVLHRLTLLCKAFGPL